LETNNVRAAIGRIGPDLAFTSASSASTAAAGTTLSVTATLRNSGGAAAGASIVRFYLSSNTTFDASDSELNAVMNVGPLGVDAVHTGTVAVPVPLNRSGSLYLLLVADAAQTVGEANETNNVFARFLQISPGS
jgi:subtilase family serine protease